MKIERGEKERERERERAVGCSGVKYKKKSEKVEDKKESWYTCVEEK